MKFPGVGLPKDLKHCSEVIRGVHIQCDGIELEFVKEPAVAAALVDVTVLVLALPWLFFAMGWPWLLIGHFPSVRTSRAVGFVSVYAGVKARQLTFFKSFEIKDLDNFYRQTVIQGLTGSSLSKTP